MKKPFFGFYNRSVILTYLGVFSSFAGISLLFSKDMAAMPYVLIFLIISACFDMFDGPVARRCKRNETEKQFGIQLDSLADTISFVLFPALIVFKFTGPGIFSYLAGFFYIFAGIMRLGFFNVTTEHSPGVFTGMPVVYAALIYPLLYLALTYAKIENFGIFFIIASIVISFLFISNFKMKKPSLKEVTMFAALAAAVVTLLLLL